MVDARPLDVGAARELLDELRDFVASHTANNPRRRALHARIASLVSSLAALGQDAEQIAQIRAIAAEPHYQGAPMLTSKHFDRSAAIVNVNWYHRLMDAIAAPDPERSTPT